MRNFSLGSALCASPRVIYVCAYVCVTPHSAFCCLCCVSILQSNASRSPERCRHAPALSPKIPGYGPSSSPDWMMYWDPNLCMQPAIWRAKGSQTSASLCSVCLHLGRAQGGCRGSDAVAGWGGDLYGCQSLWVGGPGWRSQCL